MIYWYNLVAMKMSKNEVVLEVTDTNKKSDIKNAIVRIDPDTMAKLGIEEGDVVEIESNKKYERTTGATVLRLFEDDREKGIIRVTGPVRRNVAVSLGETVVVRKAEVADAESVTLAPVDMILSVDKDFTRYIKTEALADRPLLEGDIQIAFMLGHPIAFRVVRTEPKGFVRLRETTTLHIQPKFDGHNFYEQD